jgi:hypothetical protein
MVTETRDVFGTNALQQLVNLYNSPQPAPAPVVIRERPESAHDVIAFIRARGWTYHPADRMPWHCGRIAVRTADVAIGLEIGEAGMELR